LESSGSIAIEAPDGIQMEAGSSSTLQFSGGTLNFSSATIPVQFSNYFQGGSTYNPGAFELQEGNTPLTATTGYVQFSAPTSVTAYTVFLPGAQGTGALTNDGSGNLSWTQSAVTNILDPVYGADPTCTNDSTTPIQNALNAVFAAGGGIVFAPAGCYKIAGNLSHPSGVDLEGAGPGFLSQSNLDGVTTLVFTGTGAMDTFTLNGTTTVNAFSTLGNLEIFGDSSDNQDGVDLTSTSTTDPVQNPHLHDLRIWNIGATALKIANVQYGNFDRISMYNTCNGFSFPTTTYYGDEYISIDHASINGTVNSSSCYPIQGSQGNEVWITNTDTGWAQTDIQLVGSTSNNPTNWTFKNVAGNPSVTGIEEYANGVYLQGADLENISFVNQFTASTGTDLWAHQSGGYFVFGTKVGRMDLSNAPSTTAPTNWLLDTGSAPSGGLPAIDPGEVRNVTGGVASIQSNPLFYSTPMFNAIFGDGNPDDADIRTISNGATTGLWANSQATGATFYGHELIFGATVCGTLPGMAYLGSTVAAGRNSESVHNAWCFANDGSLG